MAISNDEAHDILVRAGDDLGRQAVECRTPFARAALAAGAQCLYTMAEALRVWMSRQRQREERGT